MMTEMSGKETQLECPRDSSVGKGLALQTPRAKADLQSPCKKPEVVVNICNFSLGRWRQGLPRAAWPCSLAKSVCHRSLRETLSNIQSGLPLKNSIQG